MVNALIDNGFDVVVNIIRILVQAQWVGKLLASLTGYLWTFSTDCTLSFWKRHSVKHSRDQDPYRPYHVE